MLQLLFCLVIWLCLGMYFLTAVYTLAQALTVALSGVGGTPLIRWPQWIVLGSAVAAILIPGVRDKLVEMAEIYQGAIRYLWNSRTRNRLTGELQDLLDRINRRPEVKNLHLLGFSRVAGRPRYRLPCWFPQSGAHPTSTLHLHGRLSAGPRADAPAAVRGGTHSSHTNQPTVDQRLQPGRRTGLKLQRPWWHRQCASSRHSTVRRHGQSARHQPWHGTNIPNSTSLTC
jgi:hypothetical protein